MQSDVTRYVICISNNFKYFDKEQSYNVILGLSLHTQLRKHFSITYFRL